MSRGCPNRCGRFIGDGNKFCSRRCFLEYHGEDQNTPVRDVLKRQGVDTETIE